MNPEFRRNLLLELTLHRLVAMPLILLLIYLAAGLAGDAESVSDTAWYVMMGLLVLWGTRLAADSVLGEVTARTWDSQRMSTIGPLAMAWSKLLGSTIYVWYGAALSVPALLYRWEKGADDLLRIVIVGLLAQAVSLFASLLVQRLRPQRLRFQMTASQLFGIASGLFVHWNLFSGQYFGPRPYGETEWYGMSIDSQQFSLATVAAFTVWACFGIYRLMRAELQFRCWPAGWTAFVVFCAVYAAGFGTDWGRYYFQTVDNFLVAAASQLLNGYLVVVALVWLAALVEPKGFVRLRRWGAALALRDPLRILERTPAWLPGMILAAVIGILLIITWSLPSHPRDVLAGTVSLRSPSAFTVALFLFLLRDVGVIHLITLDGRKRRVHMTVLVYLAVLYVLFPVVLAAADWEAALPVFLPYAEGHPLIVTLPVLLQVAIVGALLVVRWRRVARSMATA